jgi:hypothetical protein
MEQMNPLVLFLLAALSFVPATAQGPALEYGAPGVRTYVSQPPDSTVPLSQESAPSKSRQNALPSYAPPPIPDDVWAEWRSRAEKEGLWKELWKSHGLSNKIRVAGKSVQGRDIYLFEAGNPNTPTLFLDSQMHGNEDHAHEVLLLCAYWLLNGAATGDATAQRIMEKNRIIFMPIVDTDLSDRRAMGTFGRVNANGVNINRNFAHNFRLQGSGTDAYSGPSAASEPETQTVRSVFKTYKPRVYVNLHTGAFMASARGDADLSNQIIQNAPSFSSHFKAGYRAASGGGGFAVSDVLEESPGCSAWLIEFFRQKTTDPEYHAWRHDATNLEIIQSRYYPMFKEFLISALKAIEAQ